MQKLTAHIPHSKIRSALRQVWRWSHARKECLKRSKIAGASAWLCETCGKPSRDVDVDHVNPVGSTPGARGSEGKTWDEFMRKLFCTAEELQVLCKKCHEKRTSEQRSGRC